MSTRQHNPVERFSGYISLDLTNKLYQVKALRLLTLLLTHPVCDSLHTPGVSTPKILELGSADDSFLKLVEKTTGGAGRGLDITKGDDLEKPFLVKSNAYDLVIALEIIEHIFDTDFFLKEIRRVLKPGGYLVLSTPNLASLKNRLRLLFGFYPQYLEYSKQGAGHLHLYTPAILRSQLQTSGLRIQKLTSPNFLCPFITKKWFPAFLREFCLFLGDLLPAFGSHLVIVASKRSEDPAYSRGT